MSALPPEADKKQTCRDVRFVPKADIRSAADSSLFDHLVSTRHSPNGIYGILGFGGLTAPDAGRRAAQVGKLRHDFRVGERGIDGRLRQMLIGSRGARVQPRVLPWGCGSLQTPVGQVDVNSSRPVQEMCCQAAARRKSAFPYQSVDKSKMG